MSDAGKRLVEIIWGDAIATRDDLRLRKRRFAHYTTAEVAVSIIENKAVWMRNASVMNDFSEMEYGQNCFRHAFSSGMAAPLRNVLDQAHPGIVARLMEAMDQSTEELRFSTYLTSLSEHDDSEDFYGRLSMWRAYGGQNGVALILNPTPFIPETDTLAAFSSKVAYETMSTFFDRFKVIADKIADLGDEVRGIEYDQVLIEIYNFFRFSVLSTKHPGFREEREWRIFHSPDLHPSLYLTPEHRVINGIYQKIFKIPLENDASKGLYGAAIPDLLDRIIIGPSQYPITVYKAFVDLLGKNGVSDPERKVFYSDIPLRR